MATVIVTFIQATYVLVTFVHISNISPVTDPNLTKRFGPQYQQYLSCYLLHFDQTFWTQFFCSFNFFGASVFFGPNFFWPKYFLDLNSFGPDFFGLYPSYPQFFSPYSDPWNSFLESGLEFQGTPNLCHLLFIRLGSPLKPTSSPDLQIILAFLAAWANPGKLSVKVRDFSAMPSASWMLYKGS